MNKQYLSRRSRWVYAIVCLLLFSPLPTQCAEPITPVLQVESGKLTGLVLDQASGLSVFRGIPYAAPPVGELRWRPPRTLATWKGVRACNQFSAIPWQRRTGTSKKSEDCLYLNVWTTAAGKQARLPVMVWIHGGGLNKGWGHIGKYDGSAFARQGVVLVSINYRLGPLGYLAHPALSAESDQGVSGNYGFLDQIASLEWVRQNIAAFGGDPDNVTIFGESAGGTSVAVLSVSPRARGLFHRAILQSPWMFGFTSSLAEPNTMELKRPTGSFPGAEELGSRWANKFVAGEGAAALAQLRKMSAQELVDAGSYDARVTVDGWLLPGRPVELFAQGKQADVPMMIGTTRNEGNYFIRYVGSKSRTEFEEKLNRFYGHAGGDVARLYPGDSAQELTGAGCLFCTDSWFLQPSRRMLQGMRHVKSAAYQYMFARSSKSYPKLGAPHAVELAYVFDTLNEKTASTEDRQLAQTMNRCWAQFARTGNPNAAGLPTWPTYTMEQRQYLVLDHEITQGTRLRDKVCDVLDRAIQDVYNKPPAAK